MKNLPLVLRAPWRAQQWPMVAYLLGFQSSSTAEHAAAASNASIR